MVSHILGYFNELELLNLCKLKNSKIDQVLANLIPGCQIFYDRLLTAFKVGEWYHPKRRKLFIVELLPGPVLQVTEQQFFPHQRWLTPSECHKVFYESFFEKCKNLFDECIPAQNKDFYCHFHRGFIIEKKGCDILVNGKLYKKTNNEYRYESANDFVTLQPYDFNVGNKSSYIHGKNIRKNVPCSVTRFYVESSSIVAHIIKRSGLSFFERLNFKKM